MRPIVIPVDTIRSQSVTWLWPGFIPRGKLIVLCGDPGLGKSFLTLDLASRATRGGPWPLAEASAPTAPSRVVLLSAEDDPADTIRPRLEAMGADLTRVMILEGVEDERRDVHDFVLGDHAASLRRLADEHPDLGLLVVDPVSAYVGATDSYNNAQVRSMLKPLAELAADCNLAVVLVTHLRKAEAQRLLHATMGSLAFTAAARVVLLVARDPGDAGRRLLLTVKSNLSNDRAGYAFRIDEGRVAWDGRVEGQADEILGGGGGSGGAGGGGVFGPSRPDLAEAVCEVIDAHHGAAPAEAILAKARALGATEAVVQKRSFKEQFGFVSEKRAEGWVWRRKGSSE